MIEFQGARPWGKLDRQERELVNWHRTEVRGLPPLTFCGPCDGTGDALCEVCHGTEEMPCSFRCANVEQPDKAPDCMCRGTGKERCVKCPRGQCPRCRGDGAVVVELREAC